MKKFFARTIKSLTNIIFGGTSSFWGMLLPRTKYNYAKSVGDGLGSSVIMAPVLWIARTFPEAPIALEKDGELEHDHAMLELIRKPNPFYSGHILSMATIISFSMQGNAYWLKLRNKQGAVIQLWYVPHWMMTPKWPDDGSVFISHYNYSPMGRAIRVEVEDVVHFRYGLDPRNIRLGLAPMGSLFREIFTDDEAANFTASLLKNSGIPGLVISPDSDTAIVTEGDKKAVKSFFKKSFGGDKRGEPVIMSSKTKVSEFGFSPKDLDLGRLREIPEERVTAILGIPAAVVGFGTGLQQTKVGATMSEMREMAYESCIIPMQRLTASEIENSLLPDFESDGKYHVIYDLSNVRVLQEDENKKAERLDRMVKGGWIKVSEARKPMGFEVEPEHEVYLRAFNIIVVPAGTSPEEQAPTIQEEGGNGKAKIKFVLPVLKTKADSPDWEQQLVIQFFKDWEHLSGIFSSELKKIFEQLGRDAALAWEKIAEEQGIVQLDAAQAPERKEITAEDVLAAAVVASLNTDVLEYGPHYLRVAEQTYETINTTLGLGVDLADDAQLRILAEGGTRKGLADLTEQTRKAVFQALKEGRELGEGPIQIARRIRDLVPPGPWSSSDIRSKVIARTETKYAQNMSSLEAYRAGGFDKVQIVDGQIATSCDFCIERNGQIITIGEAEALWEHPNGTLSLVPVIE